MTLPSSRRRCRLPVALLVLLLTGNVLFIPVAGKCQVSPSHFSFALTGGKVIPTAGSPFGGDNPTYGFDAAVCWRQEDEQQYWTTFWNHPYAGIRTNYAHILNGIAGDRFGLAGFLQGPITRHIDWVYGAGFSLYTRPYRFTHDPENIYIGSVVNCLIDVGLVLNFPVGENYTLFATGKLVHSSNGYLYKPNHGLNYLQAEVGCRFGAAQSPVKTSLQDSTFTPFGRWFVMVAPGAAMSRNDPLDKIVYYPTYMSQVGYTRYFHPCFAYGGALDLSYNFAHRKLAPVDEWPVYPAVSVFGDCLWGTFDLRLGVAHYLSYYPQNWFQYYERVAIYYRFGEELRHRAGVGMKVHGDHIDFVEWTYSIEF